MNEKFAKFIICILTFLVMALSALVFSTHSPNRTVTQIYYRYSESDMAHYQALDTNENKSSSKTSNTKTTSTKTTSTKITDSDTKTTKETIKDTTKDTEKITSTKTIEKYYYYGKNSDDKDDDSAIPLPPSESIIYGDFEDNTTPSSSEETSNPDSSLPDSSEESSELEESSNPSESEPSVEEDFSEIERYAEKLSTEYHIDLEIATEHNLHGLEDGYFTKTDEAESFLSTIEEVLNRMTPDLFEGILTHHKQVHIYLAARLPEDMENMIIEENDITIWLGFYSGNWEQDFCTDLYHICEQILGESEDLEVLYQEFLQLNPSDFHYGTYDSEYVNQTDISKNYFLNIASELSPEQDRYYLLTSYWCKTIPEEYLTEECPIYHKVTCLLNILENHLYKKESSSFGNAE